MLVWRNSDFLCMYVCMCIDIKIPVGVSGKCVTGGDAGSLNLICYTSAHIYIYIIYNEGTPFSWNEFRGLARCGHERFEQQGALGSSAQTAYRTSAFGHDVGTRGSRGLLHSPQWRPFPDRTQTRVLDDEEDEHTYSLAMNVLSVDKIMAATMFRMIAELEEEEKYRLGRIQNRGVVQKNNDVIIYYKGFVYNT